MEYLANSHNTIIGNFEMPYHSAVKIQSTIDIHYSSCKHQGNCLLSCYGMSYQDIREFCTFTDELL